MSELFIDVLNVEIKSICEKLWRIYVVAEKGRIPAAWLY